MMDVSYGRLRGMDNTRPIIATVWRLEEFSPAVVQMTEHTGTIALVDLSHLSLAAAAPTLNRIGARGETVHYKVAPEALDDPILPELLKSLAIRGLWVELHPLLLEASPHLALQRLTALSTGVEIFPILSDVNFILEALEQHPYLPQLVLKGCEAAGLVSSESTFTLYATLRDHLRQRQSAPGLVIWGGVATPEAAAAFLTTGTRGLVLESLHWLTDLAGTGGSCRQGIKKLRPDHTQLVGLNLKAPYRLFNKGNSLAVKRLLELAPAGVWHVTGEESQAFARKASRLAQAPQQSDFSREEVIPLGAEAAFAAAFAARYGSGTEEALRGFLTDVATECARAREKADLLAHSPVAREMGTHYPIIQGAMSWITDVPEFARAVAEAGGLPTVALGLMDQDALTRKLQRLPEVMGDRPYAVNIIGLADNPHRDLQLQWITRHRPRFTVIAAGEPSFAQDLQEQGLEVMYLAPNEDLLRLACRAGVRYLILEGNEAGGHVGQHTTLTLAQIALELKRREPQLLEGRRVVLAGGIYQRETAFMAAMLGADAVQVGTAYLATKEIVNTGALTALYQKLILEAAPGSTVVSGEATGLRVRSLKTPVMEHLAALERDFLGGRQDEASFRRELESLAAGSLLVAARGIAGPQGSPLPEAACLEKGQFMSGACTGAITQVKSVAELNQNLAEGPLHLTQPEIEPVKKAAAVSRRPPRAAAREGGRERIAITGMSVVNALGNSPEEIWAASLAMKSGITLVPPNRWDYRPFYHFRPRMPEKTYCKVGAFQNLDISRKDLEVPPQDFRTMTHATKVTLWLAGQAIQDSGILAADIPRERIAVLVSQNSGEAAGTLIDILMRGAWSGILEAIQRVVSLPQDAQEALTREVISGRLAIDDTTLLGRLNCTAGGFISNKYGFMGPSFAVSAACASSLVALYCAIQLIRNGIIDAAIVGGGEESLTPFHFLEFSALGALAGISGTDCPPPESSRPFDLKRDGMVLGEGGAMIVIESERLARRRGARVHAYLTGTGASNNHLGLVESSRDTQEIAIRASFQDAPYGPETVDLVECHATATFQGDVEEVKALQAFYRTNGRTMLTSFKSQIGHTLGASGLNSLVRGVKAMQANVFPATLNYRTPDPAMNFEDSGLVVATEPSQWKSANGRPRRLQVNSFGFGGSNYVMQLEESREGKDTVLVSLPEEVSPPVAAGLDQGRPAGLFCGRMEVDGGSYRLALVAASELEARSRIQELPPLEGAISEKMLRVLGRKGIFLGEEGTAPQPLAMVFPGQGAQYAGMGRELYETFPMIRYWLDRVAEVANFDLLNLLFEDREEDLQKTRWQQPATYSLEFAIMQYLRSLGVEPQAMAGHSLGELAALATAGVFSCEDGFRLVNMRALCMDKACEMNVDPGIMIATDAPLQLVEAKVRGLDRVYITNYNAPNQVVVGGDTAAVQALREGIKSEGYRATQLKVSMAFHSPMMRVIHDEMEEFLSHITFHAPRIPVISNTTKQPFPADPAEIKKIIMAHLESPVQWMSNVRTLWQDYGIRVFLEVGPGDTMSNLISQILESPNCIPTCLPEAEKATLQGSMAQLFVRGHLELAGPLKFISLPGGRVLSQPAATAPPVARLATTATLATAEPLERIIQREVNAFVLESFGRFLKPSLLAAIRREYDPNFSEENLEHLLQSGQSSWNPPAAASCTIATTNSLSAAPLPAIEPPPPRPQALPEGGADYLEAVIGLIMEATGYERDEIEPDMDLRSDLAIRSSRLPVIMDAAESRFGIEIRLEDFMDVRTVRDLATRISEVVVRGEGQGASRTGERVTADSRVAVDASVGPAKHLKRVIFEPLALPDFSPQPLALTAADTVAIFHPGGSSALLEEVSELLPREWGCAIRSMAFLEARPDGSGFDLRQPEGACQAAFKLSEDPSLAGIIILLDDSLKSRLQGMEDLPRVLEGCFPLLQALASASRKKFALVLHRSQDEAGDEHLLSQGLLGLFLSAAQEYPDLLFRTLRLDMETEMPPALRQALDPQQPVIDTWYRQGQIMTTSGQVAPAEAIEADLPLLNRGDVVVFSGGSYGITTHLVKSLAPFHPHLVLLGRTAIDLGEKITELLLAEEPSEKALRWEIMQQKPDISQEDLKWELARMLQARQVMQTLEELRAAGMEVDYLSCDVTDLEQVQEAVGEIIRRFGRIDGLVHGAGVLRDKLLANLRPEEVAPVLDVKFKGAWNLFKSASEAGLRFLVALSSATAILGNRGQTNYSAANRMMSALVSQIKTQHPALRCKTLILSAISGGGMSDDDPELRRLLEKMGVGYLEPPEFQELFCRELFLADQQEVWVMFMTTVPGTKHARLDTAEAAPVSPGLKDGMLVFAPEQFPLIDAVSHLDLEKGVLQASRVFSQERDLWIFDHKPFKFLKSSLVSAIMVLETFMEAARLLYPYLKVRLVREVEFLEAIEVPPDVAINTVITCRRLGEAEGEVGCQLTMESPLLSPTGKALDKKVINYRAQVVLAREAPPWTNLPGFPLNPEDLDTRSADLEEISGWYDKRTDMQGRYRVMEHFDGTGPGIIRGAITYRTNRDFSHLQAPSLQYSPYVLEGLMQITNFYNFMRHDEDERTLIPIRIQEMTFNRRCRDQEPVILEGRLQEEGPGQVTWEAQALDADGQPLMQVQGLKLRFFSE